MKYFTIANSKQSHSTLFVVRLVVLVVSALW